MNNTATVETLTAEVRVLMVDKRQITLSIYRQLDQFDLHSNPLDNFVPFGRVRADSKRTEFSEWSGHLKVRAAYEFVGRAQTSDSLMRCVIYRSDMREILDSDDKTTLDRWIQLPLIVLAGLK